jgi:hypothetical protein
MWASIDRRRAALTATPESTVLLNRKFCGAATAVYDMVVSLALGMNKASKSVASCGLRLHARHLEGVHLENCRERWKPQE